MEKETNLQVGPAALIEVKPKGIDSEKVTQAEFKRYLRQVVQKIRDGRAQKGLRQTDVAEMVGLNYRHYQRIEAGTVNLKLETLYRLSKLFGVSVTDIIDDEKK
jgi:DNA-binding XRE family transcriptional regulator